MNTLSKSDHIVNTSVGRTAHRAQRFSAHGAHVPDVEVSATPYSNRGFGRSHNAPLVFSIDWLTVTIHAGLTDVLEFVKLLGLDVGLEDAGHGIQGFSRAMRGLHGFQIGCFPKDGEYCTLRLPGKAMDYVGLDRLQTFYTALCEAGLQGLRWNVTRLDLAFDTQLFQVADVAAARQAGLVSCSALTFNEIVNYEREDVTGHTLYFGSRQSLAMLRVYLKTDGSSYGDEPFTRVELELKQERATFALMQIMAAPMEEWSTIAGGLLAGFLEVKTSWWSGWVSKFRRSWLKLRRNIPTIESARTWLMSQVAPSLAMVAAALSGGEVDGMTTFVRQVLQHGQGRWKNHQRALIEEFSPDHMQHFAIFEV